MTGQGRFRLGPFAVDGAGRLSPGGPGEMPAFRLRWRGRLVQLHMAEGATATGGVLAVETVLGRVPSTAKAPRDGAAGDRPHAFAVLRGLPAALPAQWRLRLLADHRIGLAADLPLDLPTGAVALVAALAQFLLDLAPYLDVLDEAGMGAGLGAAAGMAKT